MIELIEIKAVNQQKYRLTFDVNDKKVNYTVSESVIIKEQLFSPRSFTKQQFTRLKQEFVFDELYIKALHFISYQTRTISEVKKKLNKETEDETMISSIISELKQLGYLSDDRYVKEYILQQIEFQLVGPKYIRQKLISKGIHFDLINQHLVSYTKEIQITKVTTLVTQMIQYPIKKTIPKAILSIKNKCVQKGFDYDVVEQVIHQMKPEILKMVQNDELLQKEFQVLCKRYDKNDWSGKDKIIKSLMSKGFFYDEIKKLF